MLIFFDDQHLLAPSKIMVNYKTSQYEHLNLFCHLSCLGDFQYVRDIFQFTVSLDHPVAYQSDKFYFLLKPNCLSFSIFVGLQIGSIDFSKLPITNALSVALRLLRQR